MVVLNSSTRAKENAVPAADYSVKSPVSERALFQRINRLLAKSGRKVMRSRSPRQREAVGSLYTVDTKRKVVVQTHVDLAALGKELGCFNNWECIVEKD